MSTRSAIGIRYADGTITGIYCHYDGYPEHNGKILYEHYLETYDVEDLLSFGSLSSLGHTPEASERRVKDMDERNFDNEKQFLDYFYGVDYYYLFEAETEDWYCAMAGELSFEPLHCFFKEFRELHE